MADRQSPERDVIISPENLFEAAKSVGAELKGKLLNGGVSPRRKSQGFDIYSAQPHQNILKRVLSHTELIERHGDGTIHNIELLVSTMTIKHDKTKIGKTNRSESSRNAVWLLALLADADEKDKIGRSFSLDTRFNVVEGEIFICFTVA